MGDPDVVFEGDEYEESLDSEFSSTKESIESDTESLESESGEE